MLALETIEKVYTISEYLELEAKTTSKHEYHNGNIIKMADADPIHNIIAVRIMAALLNVLDNKTLDYFVLNSDQQIWIEEYNKFVYPDAVVVCEKIKFYPKSKAIINPLLVVEVLSPSTARYDRTGKFLQYKTIPAFQEYLLVRQDKPWVSASYRQKPNLWEDTTVTNINDSIRLQSIDAALRLKDFYKGVNFE